MGGGHIATPSPNQYDSLRAKLDELNYLYPFSSDSITLVEQLLSDLISTVTSYKGLERELEIKAEELRVAAEEINRLGVIENPKLVRDNNELHMQLVRETEKWEEKSMELINQSRSKDEEILRLELLVSQLNWKNKNLVNENLEMKERISQLILQKQSGDILKCGINSTISSSLGILDPALVSANDRTTIPPPPHSFDSLAPQVASLQQENKELEQLLLSAQSEFVTMESKMTLLEEKLLGPSVSDSTSALIRDRGEAQLVSELNAKLDFVNNKYRELKEMHARCGVVSCSNSPLEDLRESRKELSLVQVRYDKLRKEYAILQSEVEELRKKRPLSRSPSRRSTVASATKFTDTRQIEDLEYRLKQVTEERDELIVKLGEIDSAIGSMEIDVRRIEQENSDLKREKISREQSFIGISKQLEEVNTLLNTLSGGDVTSSGNFGEMIERQKFRISQLEREIVSRDEEIERLTMSLEMVRRDSRSVSANRSVVDTRLREMEIQLNQEQGERRRLETEISQLKSLIVSSTQAKESAMNDLRTCQKELLEAKRTVSEIGEIERNRSSLQLRTTEEIAALKNTLSRTDMERDELQRICDEQSEKMEVLRETNSKLRTANMELEKVLSQQGMESDRLRRLMEEKEIEIDRIMRRNNEQASSCNRNEQMVVSLQDQLTVASNEAMELTRANQKLRNEIANMNGKLVQLTSFHNQSREEVHSAIENLKITEKERDDILSMYKQLINENKHLQMNFSKICSKQDLVDVKDEEIVGLKQQCEILQKQLKQAQLDIGSLRTQLSRASDQLRSVGTCGGGGGGGRITDNPVDVKLVELENRNKDLMDQVNTLENMLGEKKKVGNSSNQLEKTIEQQYALIGEMDSEQARLIVENSRLREQLALVASRVAAG